MTGAFRYRAFLSYSHADEALATRLHRALEHYVVPRRVRKAHGLPPRLTPIFRDVEELAAASGLTTRLQDALDQSQWLVVLCSPAAALSKYVDEEITYFVGKHGPGRVLCALLAGEPADAFPPAIRAFGEEPLAADFRPGRDFELAKLKLLAALASVGFNELRDCEAQRKRRRRTVAVAACAIVASLSLLTWDLLYREQVRYFQGYERRDGVWEGIGEVSESAARRRHQNYRFVRHGRLHRPAEVRVTTGLGTCYYQTLDSVLGTPLGNPGSYINAPACSVTFDYGGDGRIQREVKRNRNGFPLEAITYTGPDVAQFTQEGFGSAASTTGIYYVQFARHADGPLRGLEREVRFFLSRDNPRPNEERHFGYRTEYDASGRRTRRVPLDGRNEPMDGATLYQYDDQGRVAQQLFVDLAGKPRQQADGCFGYRNRYSEAGNLVLATCLDAEGRTGMDVRGVSSNEYQHDDDGNLVRERTLDAAGRPTRDARGYADVRMAYDTRGWPTQKTIFDEMGRPATDREGGHGWTSRHDALGNPVEYTYFDLSRKPACITSGVCVWRLEYDKRGLCVGQTYFTPDGQPMLIAYGAGMKVIIDDRGSSTEVARLGLDGKPFVVPDLGYAIVRMRYNERGALLERGFFDADGKPLTQKTGQAAAQFEYDDLGNMVERRFLDTQGKPVRITEGYSIDRRKVDRLGQVVERTFYDENRQPVMHRNGYYGFRTQYDHRGQETEAVYLGPDGRPFRSASNGSFGLRYQRNAFGDIETTTFLDASGQPLAGTSLGRIDYRFDGYRREIERRYSSGDAKPAAAPETGCYIFRTEYDSTGRTTAERCLDAGERPINRKDEGWSVKTIAYETGRKLEERLVDSQGREVKPKTLPQSTARARASR